MDYKDRPVEEDEDYDDVYIDEKEDGFEDDLFLDEEMKNNRKSHSSGKDDFYEEVSEEPKEVQTTLDKSDKVEEKAVHTEKADKKAKKVSLSQKKRNVAKKEKNNGGEDKVEEKKSKKEHASRDNPKKASSADKPSKKPQKNKKKNYFWPIFLAIVGIALIVLIIFVAKESMNKTEKNVIAVVNGEDITKEQLDKEYEFFFLLGGLPDAYKDVITKGVFLNDSLIAEVLILQDAKEKGISIDMTDSSAMLFSSIEQAGLSKEDFESALKERGLELEEAEVYFNNQLVSFALLNETVLGEIEVSDEEVDAAYGENKDLFESQNKSLDDVRENLRAVMLGQKQREAAQEYLRFLIDTADIKIYYSEASEESAASVEQTGISSAEEQENSEFEITTFQETQDELCAENGKPLVIMFSTTYCPHCVWVKETFDSVVSDYENIAAYHWELDQSDNTLTGAIESALPKDHVSILKMYDPEGYVPAFVVGCRYYRIGNGYESSDDLESEEAELRAVIEKVTATA